jgi:Flp pilus assembly secretin CpaC
MKIRVRAYLARARSLKDSAMTRFVRASAVLVALGAASVAGAVYAQSARLNVGIDQAQRVALRGAAASVIVGNPQIADVTVVDANTLYVTGKGYGVTEVVAVDAVGRTVFQSEVVVTGAAGSSTVRVWRGGQATEMACASSCAPSVRSANGGSAPAASVPTAP